MTAQLSEFATTMAGDENGGGNDSGGDESSSAVATERVVLIQFKVEEREDVDGDAAGTSAGPRRDDVAVLGPNVIVCPPSPRPFTEVGKCSTFRSM